MKKSLSAALLVLLALAAPALAETLWSSRIGDINFPGLTPTAINNMSIGAATPAPGKFTTLNASGQITSELRSAHHRLRCMRDDDERCHCRRQHQPGGTDHDRSRRDDVMCGLVFCDPCRRTESLCPVPDERDCGCSRNNCRQDQRANNRRIHDHWIRTRQLELRLHLPLIR
jgi:hypothetical protein